MKTNRTWQISSNKHRKHASTLRTGQCESARLEATGLTMSGLVLCFWWCCLPSCTGTFKFLVEGKKPSTTTTNAFFFAQETNYYYRIRMQTLRVTKLGYEPAWRHLWATSALTYYNKRSFSETTLAFMCNLYKRRHFQFLGFDSQWSQTY